jgi:hypothetical protein
VRSRRGRRAAAILLLAFPAAAAVQGVLDSGAEVVVHLVLAAGCLLLATAIRDFDNVAPWLRPVGWLSTGGLAAVFALQATSSLFAGSALQHLAYGVLGQWPEAVLHHLFTLWCIAVLVQDSQGATRLLGLGALGLVLGLEVYRYRLALAHLSLNVEAPVLMLLYFLPIVWLLLESGKTLLTPRGSTL